MTGRKLSHVELQDHIVKLLGLHGWSHLHVRRSIGKGRKWVTATNVKGWPDLFCWNPRQPGRFLAIEVKVPPDKLSPEQADVLAELYEAGVETMVLVEEGLAELPSILRPRRGAGYPVADQTNPDREAM